MVPSADARSRQCAQSRLVCPCRGLGREGPDAAHLVVKTHHWSSEWDPTSVDLIFLTERDLGGVVNSYLRVGWLSPGLE
jgi:hypothetical protein